jgi:hypothetical protein
VTDASPQLVDACRSVASEAKMAFSEFFFNAFHGEFDSLKSVWQGFLDALLRMIANFMAQAVVAGFIRFIGGVVLGQATDGTAIPVSVGGTTTGASGGGISGTGVSTGSGAGDAVVGTIVSTAASAGIKAAWTAIFGSAAAAGVTGTAVGTAGVGAGVSAAGTATLGGAAAAEGAAASGAAAGASGGAVGGLGLAGAGVAAASIAVMAGILIMGALGEFDKDQKKVFAQGVVGLDARLGEVQTAIRDNGFTNMGELEVTRQVAEGVLKGNENYIRNGEITEEGMETLREWFGEQADMIAQQILVAGEAVRAEQARTVAAVIAGDERAIAAQMAHTQQLSVTLATGQQVMVQALTLASGQTVQAIVGANGELTNQVILSNGELAEVVREGDVETIRLLGEEVALSQQDVERLDAQTALIDQVRAFVSTLPGIEGQSRDQVEALVNMIVETIGVRGDVQGVIAAILDQLVPGQAEANRAIAELAARELEVHVEVHVGGEGFQHGAIVRRPTFARIGEAGPEGVFPLNSRGAAAARAVFGGSDDEDRRLMRQQNALLRRQNEILSDLARRRRAGGVHGMP